MSDALIKLKHRGPDEIRSLSKGQATLGHARLSILDLQNSHQPMEARNERYALVYNGEIYNYQELRNSLSTKWKFVTRGDTEVLLAGLIVHGINFLKEIEGMWAFAFWDSKTHELLLSRDRMGKKPLFYSETKETFSCASELPALQSLLFSPFTEDLDSIADYFRYGYCLPGYTCWENVFEVLPGHWLRWKPGEVIEQQPYWSFSPPNSETAAPKEEDLITSIEQAVSKRLIADVEVAAFLSGGIDSSLICALAMKDLAQPLKTYTIGFTEQAFDERKYAYDVASMLGTKHHEEILSGWDESQLEALLCNHIGQPFADASLLPTALVSKLAARNVKVALSGDGGDELFGGYQRYQARIIMRWYSRLPECLRNSVEKIVRSLPEPMAHHSRSIFKKAHLFMDISRRYEAETPYTAPLMFQPAEYATLFPDLQGRGKRPPALLEETNVDDLQRMLYADSLIYLPQDILVKVDRASMAYSLEARAPFLDHKVVELAFSYPVNQHLKLGNGKRRLKQAFYNMLPKSIWNRRKQGFGVPIHQWFRGELGERMHNYLSNNSGVINSENASKLLKEHKHGKRDNGYRLWMMYSYLKIISS